MNFSLWLNDIIFFIKMSERFFCFRFAIKGLKIFCKSNFRLIFLYFLASK